MKVLLLGALSTGKIALETLHAHGGFEVMFMGHNRVDASDFTDVFDTAKSYGYEMVCLGQGNGGRPDVAIAPGGINGSQGLHYARVFAENFAPDIGICMGWSDLIKSGMLQVPRLGWIGHHESLLPKRRGRAPIPWPIILGAKETGISFFWLTEGVDDGDIFAQRAVPIGDDDYAQDLLDKTNEATRALLTEEVLPALARGETPRTPQNHAEATYTHRRTPDMGLLDFNKPADEVCRLIRGVSHPYPGAFVYNRLRRVTIWRATPIGTIFDSMKHWQPGKVFKFEGRLSVMCGGQSFFFLEEYTGHVEVGDRLGCWE